MKKKLTCHCGAIEIEANVVLKGTRVDGVYSSDPEKNKNAKKFSEITFDEAYRNNLNPMLLFNKIVNYVYLALL